jgi:hypothetical protein
VVTQGVVDLLEVVEVHEQHGHLAVGGPRPCQRLVDAAAEQTAVRQRGEGVVEGLVLLLHRLVPQAVDQAAVLQRHAGVVGEGLEQLEVLGVEGAHVTKAVGDGDHADDAVLAAERDGHRVLVPDGGHLPAGLVAVAPPDEHGVTGQGRRPPGRGEARRLGRALDVAVGTEADAERVPPRPGQPDLGGVRPQEVPGLQEDRAEHRLGLDGAADRPGEPVQQLQAGVPLRQRGVGAVGEEEDGGQDDEEPGGPHVAVEDDDGDEAEAGVRAHGHGAGHDHLVEHAPVEGVLVQRHREGDRQRPEEVAHQHGGEGRQPAPGLRRQGVVQHQPVDDDGQ